MRIVHLAAEFAPIAKAGGLGEVIVGLSRALTQKGLDVEVLLPKYDFIRLESGKIKQKVPHFQCLGNDNTAWSAVVEECHLTLLEAHHPAQFFNRGKIYGLEDDIARFLYFSRLAIEYLLIQGQPIDILHLHDWHVSLVAPMVKKLFKGLEVKAVVLTIHNLEYQGKCTVRDLENIGCGPLAREHAVNLLEMGILYADAVIPVSPSYAEEILTPEYGFGLDPVLRQFAVKIHGILNGIDRKIWTPEKDPLFDVHYSTESVQKGKKHYKRKFQKDTEKTPWIGAVSRLVPQKGPALLEEALYTTLKLNGTFLLLGSSPIPQIQEQFYKLQVKYKGHPQVFFHFEYEETLAHEMYAALDYLLVPSKFEPCGLTQMIAMRYGTVPIVRKTGGLKDTVFDCEDSRISVDKRNGFVFEAFTADSMNHTLQRAFDLFRFNPNTYHSLVRKGMLSDFSWDKPAEAYCKLYRSLELVRQQSR
ncbi:MAG: hypothetical protein A3D96_02795 [Chlamydiae bacterium RIFCSPHIGHO2_12_FULL_44_59]|nr:MAG: hypothetical protein A2796_07145 [Chlamydiae bacterium RIFCSPHIGHO2_01_FULL_44_39]OGN57020.1 MAG: hypothetical protein A3C42_05470 [Chlamydiae bacterium RIFCSPHIGHO2_02_FULL_45_9]OGN61010.1 MAG: hypothetical protein A3D96_02795 [Chlamydiae bacterium RIFCSPHIGHO2_12_FULL_44_59]OGN66786.1 MAG: hypothetical protein A2978_00280 [Chlamydiae bacterium RIFCSPLOWO2_01_FULL_44_52]OGN69980.1 MAG: hypothetical protein A3I67_01595 [Chlamydiae bacterium RIFCSPLOWO2_02_FULL_45_22]OGN71051.1 MAG: hyp